MLITLCGHHVTVRLTTANGHYAPEAASMMIIAATTTMLVLSATTTSSRTRVAVTTAEKALASTESIAAPVEERAELAVGDAGASTETRTRAAPSAGTTAFAPGPSTGFNMFKCQGFQALCRVVAPRRHPRMADSAWR